MNFFLHKFRHTFALYGVIQGLEISSAQRDPYQTDGTLGPGKTYDHLPLLDAERGEIDKAKRAIEDRIATAICNNAMSTGRLSICSARAVTSEAFPFQPGSRRL
jgi:hypothetical protein